MKRNTDIKEMLKAKHISYMELGEMIGVCDRTVTRYMAMNLPSELRERIIQAINSKEEE